MSLFVNQNEKILGTFGCGTVTNKRVYMSGKCVFRSGSGYFSCQQEHILDLKDVTGTCFEYYSRPLRLVIAILLFLVSVFLLIFSKYNENMLYAGITTIILAVAFLIGYILSRKTIMRIDYAGGNIGLRLDTFGKEPASEFMKTIRMAKDAITGYQKL